MTTSLFTPIAALSASQAGALDGFKTSCTCCGLVIKSSLHTLLVQDMLDHQTWHEGRGK